MLDISRLLDFIENDDPISAQNCMDAFRARISNLGNWETEAFQDVQAWIDSEQGSSLNSSSRRLKKNATESAEQLIRHHG